MENIKMFQTTPRIIMGRGAVARSVDEIQRLGCKKIMVVSDKGLVKAGISGKLETLLTSNGIPFLRFDEVESDPSLDTAMAAAKLIQENNVDMVIGIGGGSPIDIAKAGAVLAVNTGDISSYVGVDLLPAPGLKTIIIPTTAGTGSEVTPIVILSDDKEKLKKGIVSPHLFPDIAILDPELTAGLPPHVTAATGMDAFIHAVEAFLSNNATPMTDMFAIQAIKLINNSLRTAFANGSDMKARADMLEGSLLAGMAFANAGVAAVHAFAYPIGAEFHIPHGVANSIMLIPVMEFNMLGKLEKFALLAEVLGENTSNLGFRDSANAALTAMRHLMQDLQLPCHLGEFGISDTDIPMLAHGVMKVTRLLANNPREMNLKAAENIYRQVL